jgi:hypothetical protein
MNRGPHNESTSRRHLVTTVNLSTALNEIAIDSGMDTSIMAPSDDIVPYDNCSSLFHMMLDDIVTSSSEVSTETANKFIKHNEELVTLLKAAKPKALNPKFREQWIKDFIAGDLYKWFTQQLNIQLNNPILKRDIARRLSLKFIARVKTPPEKRTIFTEIQPIDLPSLRWTLAHKEVPPSWSNDRVESFKKDLEAAQQTIIDGMMSCAKLQQQIGDAIFSDIITTIGILPITLWNTHFDTLLEHSFTDYEFKARGAPTSDGSAPSSSDDFPTHFHYIFHTSLLKFLHSHVRTLTDENRRISADVTARARSMATSNSDSSSSHPDKHSHSVTPSSNSTASSSHSSVHRKVDATYSSGNKRGTSSTSNSHDSHHPPNYKRQRTANKGSSHS